MKKRIMVLLCIFILSMTGCSEQLKEEAEAIEAQEVESCDRPDN